MPDSSYSNLPEHVTMPLLTLVTRQSLDQDYAYVAQRRAAGGDPPTSRSSVFALVAVLAGFGLLVSTAAAQRSRDASVDETSRASLIAQVEAKRTTLGRLQDRIADLQDATTAARQRRDEATVADDAATARLRRLQSRTGYGVVDGSGVRIVVDDSPSGLETAVVRDTDLALLVDALWGVGAEAVAINGQRLTTLTAIRNASVAIHVNGRPLAPPYVVEAIGDPRTLQATLADSQRGAQFFALARAVGLPVSMTNEEVLQLPSARLPVLRYATTGPGVDNGGANKEEAP
jgi:uncharacterized protein YlxW (UPF0749 family)